MKDADQVSPPPTQGAANKRHSQRTFGHVFKARGACAPSAQVSCVEHPWCVVVRWWSVRKCVKLGQCMPHATLALCNGSGADDSHQSTCALLRHTGLRANVLVCLVWCAPRAPFALHLVTCLLVRVLVRSVPACMHVSRRDCWLCCCTPLSLCIFPCPCISWPTSLSVCFRVPLFSAYANDSYNDSGDTYYEAYCYSYNPYAYAL